MSAPQTNLEMWSRGLDAMIMAPTMMGCAVFATTPLGVRVAANLGALQDADFDMKETRALLAIACDRLSGLALEGAVVYGSYEGEPDV